MRCEIPITMYKMYVSLCSYYTIRILISKTLTGTYEGGYTYVFEVWCYRTLDIVIYIVTKCYIYNIYIYIHVCIYIYIYICVKKIHILKKNAVMLHMFNDIFPMLMLYSWRKCWLLSSVLSGLIYTMTLDLKFLYSVLCPGVQPILACNVQGFW